MIIVVVAVVIIAKTYGIWCYYMPGINLNTYTLYFLKGRA